MITVELGATRRSSSHMHSSGDDGGGSGELRSRRCSLWFDVFWLHGNNRRSRVVGSE